jgi:hypothetical protein
MNASSESGLCALTISRERGVISQEEYISVYTGCSRKGKEEHEKNEKGGPSADRRLEVLVAGHPICA